MCIAIIDFGMGNIHSIQKATRMFAANVQYTADSEVISAAKAIILPGDGAFPAAMQGLSRELATLLKQKIAAECPILGICIGFQILFQDSNEFQEQQVIPGLAMLPGKIRKFQLPSARSDRSPNTLPSARSDRPSNTLTKRTLRQTVKTISYSAHGMEYFATHSRDQMVSNFAS